jgi:hypothetical protein
MATFPTPQAEQPPPPLPGVTGLNEQMNNYLRAFSLWCRGGFRARQDMNVAASGIMLQANDAPAGTTPAVWYLQVNTAGQFIASQTPLGGGKP